jgi:rubrerythrin
MSEKVDSLLSSFVDELEKNNQRYERFVDLAKSEGLPLAAKLFRAVIASERARADLFRNYMVHHVSESHDYFICPHCGLVFVPEAPEKCPVDETAGSQFVIIR